jgi:hypothetical protein
MNSKFFKYIVFILFVFAFLQGRAQEDDYYEQLLKETVEVENPVYKPVIGFGTGVFTFLGDVKNYYVNPLLGKPSYKVNVSTYIDNQHFFKANFFLLYGNVSGNERSVTDLSRNLNFSTDLITFGLNVNYDFRHMLKGNRLIRPFVSLGVENIQFSAKGDLYDARGDLYHYWSDGTIRDLPEGSNDPAANIIRRDYTYESDLRELDLYGMGNYSQNTFAVPVDAGLDLHLGDRVMIRLASSLHYTFTDLMDNVSYENVSGIKGDTYNDMFMFTYATIHLDLFSEDKVKVVEKLFAEVDFDYTMYGDDDLDNVFDGWDKCPGTPRGVSVDTLGCPFDDDKDGIPNYMDKEKYTPKGAFVNDQGVQMTEDEIIALTDYSSAVKREEVDLYLLRNLAASNYKRKMYLSIPEKFEHLDNDGDGYISFDEVLGAIDAFFDFESELTTDDIYELNNFFFAQ